MEGFSFETFGLDMNQILSDLEMVASTLLDDHPASEQPRQQSSPPMFYLGKKLSIYYETLEDFGHAFNLMCDVECEVGCFFCKTNHDNEVAGSIDERLLVESGFRLEAIVENSFWQRHPAIAARGVDWHRQAMGWDDSDSDWSN